MLWRPNFDSKQINTVCKTLETPPPSLRQIHAQGLRLLYWISVCKRFYKKKKKANHFLLHSMRCFSPVYLSRSDRREPAAVVSHTSDHAHTHTRARAHDPTQGNWLQSFSELLPTPPHPHPHPPTNAFSLISVLGETFLAASVKRPTSHRPSSARWGKSHRSCLGGWPQEE